MPPNLSNTVEIHFAERLALTGNTVLGLLEAFR
jgi:hypothetical protein